MADGKTYERSWAEAWVRDNDLAPGSRPATTPQEPRCACACAQACMRRDADAHPHSHTHARAVPNLALKRMIREHVSHAQGSVPTQRPRAGELHIHPLGEPKFAPKSLKRKVREHASHAQGSVLTQRPRGGAPHPSKRRTQICTEDP